MEVRACKDALSTFSALPHRLQVLGEIGGVTYVDDSISTIPEAALGAVDAFSGRPITIILGGLDRGQEWQVLASSFVGMQLHAVVTAGQNGDRIFEALRLAKESASSSLPILLSAKDLEEAVQLAKRNTPAGGVVLLSPAAPSYGAFRNFEERGDAFKTAAGF